MTESPVPIVEPHDPYACLTPQDQLALCRAFDAPTPTPDVPFSVCLESTARLCSREDGTSYVEPWRAETMYDALATTTDVRLMIAAHALRCGVKKMPDDAQLRPKPLPPLRHAPKKSAPKDDRSEAERAAQRDLDSAVVRGEPPEVLASLTADRDAARPPTAAPAVKSRTRVPPAHVLTRLAPNPRKRGTETWERYERYALGLTVAQLVERGVRRGDVVWDLDRRFVEFGPPDLTSNVPEDSK